MEPSSSPKPSVTPTAVKASKPKKVLMPPPKKQWLVFVAGINLFGGVIGALTALILQKNDLAAGFFLGSLLCTLNLYVLQILTARILKRGEKGRRGFWFWNLIRWMLLAVACRGFLFISIPCLLAGVGSYIWFLLVLGFAQRRTF